MHALSLSVAHTIAFSSFIKATYFQKCSVLGLEYMLFHQKESQTSAIIPKHCGFQTYYLVSLLHALDLLQ